MSILKLKAQNFNEIDTPRCDTSGSWYVLGYDNSQGGDPMLAQMDCNRNIVYIKYCSLKLAKFYIKLN